MASSSSQTAAAANRFAGLQLNVSGDEPAADTGDGAGQVVDEHVADERSFQRVAGNPEHDHRRSTAVTDGIYSTDKPQVSKLRFKTTDDEETHPRYGAGNPEYNYRMSTAVTDGIYSTDKPQVSKVRFKYRENSEEYWYPASGPITNNSHSAHKPIPADLRFNSAKRRGYQAGSVGALRWKARYHTSR
ncbi:hypothetical protein LTR09_006685 [Extremus antarcticus]|uniref:Uncharacterized protein n=1 Tax=Extremus antarcticus TaxID=702011 RepID=A0AAJ0DDN6_9PEZI|nr:hypothetical protein LTR09_006685 [Extremus antarcticus]